ncbi:cellulase family glycosylhydrolase [Saprospiraceae bacterium]|nr:cellulase family glycosylhydrolase [Saprospiraceae bacterium]
MPCTSQEVDIKNGVNIQASYHNGGYVNIGWELMETYPAIEAVRIEIEPNRIYQAVTWIEEAHEHGYQVIATYHDSKKLGSDNRDDLNMAAQWWKDYYTILASSGPIIINVMNEWGSHDLSAKKYAEAYNEAISTIRTVYDGQLIVDVPGYGQATKIAADAYPLFEDKKIRYSVHVYTSAFNREEQRWLSAEDLEYLNTCGAKCMVGEFCDASLGGADWCGLIDKCYEAGWPLFGWAWNGDGKNMNMIEPHWKDEPLASSFTPTEFMQIIIDKLSGVPCYTQADEDCEPNHIGEFCDDGNDYTINDRWNEYCHCTGVYTSILDANIEADLDLIIYPNPVTENTEITIELFKNYSSGQVLIVNSIGQSQMSEIVDQGQQRVLINTSQLEPGIYWASFRNSEKTSVARAFLVF